jgi:hypothetical protein
MGQSLQDVQDLMAMARRLRRIADARPRDGIYQRLLVAAAEIEERARLLAVAEEPSAPEKEKESAPPINLVI